MQSLVGIYSTQLGIAHSLQLNFRDLGVWPLSERSVQIQLSVKELLPGFQTVFGPIVLCIYGLLWKTICMFFFKFCFLYFPLFVLVAVNT